MTPENDTIIDSNALSPVDGEGRPIPVTIPIALAPGVKVVYSTRLGGVSEGDAASCNLGGRGGDDPDRVLANREALSRTVGAPILLVSQVHSATAVDVDAASWVETPYGADVVDDDGAIIAADAMVSTRRSVGLGIFAADCLPVLLADPQAGVIAAAHCGRRGVVGGVVGSTVRLMLEKGADPNRIVATLGPRICGSCYEVSDDIADEFESHWPGSSTRSRFVGRGVDLAFSARRSLLESGIHADNIVDSASRVAATTRYLESDAELALLCSRDGEGSPDLGHRLDSVDDVMCTMENPLWYSHRRASIARKNLEGRMLAVISMG